MKLMVGKGRPPPMVYEMFLLLELSPMDISNASVTEEMQTGALMRVAIKDVVGC